MAFDVTPLSSYVRQNEGAMIAKSLTEAKTQQLMQIRSGIKSADTINILETDAIFQEGGSCGFNASGTTTFSQRTITVGKIKVNEALCPKTLEDYFTQYKLTAGSTYDSIPF